MAEGGHSTAPGLGHLSAGAMSAAWNWEAWGRGDDQERWCLPPRKCLFLPAKSSGDPVGLHKRPRVARKQRRAGEAGTGPRGSSEASAGLGSRLSPLAVPSAALQACLSALTFAARNRGSEMASHLPGVTQLIREGIVPGAWVSLSPF